MPLPDVTVTAISVKGGTLVDTKLPYAIHTLKSGDRAVVFASFDGAFAPDHTYAMTVEGTMANGIPFITQSDLRVPPRSPGEAIARSASAMPHKVSGGKYPPQTPNFRPEVNRNPKWAVPLGPHRPLKRTSETKLERAQLGDPPGIVFDRNQPLGIDSGLIGEPSGGAGGGIVFATGNFFAGYSDGGGAFTPLDPTTIFPNDLGGYCCDQIVQYAPTIDRVIWYLQYGEGARIASASPAGIRASRGTAWTYWDIPSASLGYGDFDFPDLSLGDHFLYASTDAGPGLLVMRLPLDEIRDGLTVHFSYTDPNKSTMAYFGHLAQNAHDEIFWAGHNTNSSLRVFSWKESSATYAWRDVALGSWPNDLANMTAALPDGQDWLAMLRGDTVFFVAGATRVLGGPSQANQVWFGWTAPSGNDFPAPHVEIAAVDRANDFALVSQGQVWSNTYAFAYPAFTSAADGEVAMALEYGGRTEWEQFAVGFWGDFTAWILTSSNAGSTRYGDYVTIRPGSGSDHRYDAFGFGVNSSPSGPVNDTRYVIFGRP
ncbi:MAG TPA: hypothetical protein VGJ82_15290 [Thermoanaerobaculia bacterium]